jgi:DNA-binding CsgD family transcriptional regulator
MLHRTLEKLAAGGAIATAALALTGGATAADRPMHPDNRATHGVGAIEAEKRDIVLRPDDRADRGLPGAPAVVVQPATSPADRGRIGDQAPAGSAARVSSDGLTRREHEVVTLVAEGLTNAEIARRLWIAPGTVRRHLENVFAKLEVHTRTAAVARLRATTIQP